MASSLLAQNTSDGMQLYEKCVNPQWVRLLDLLQMKVRYNRCLGVELHTEDGHRRWSCVIFERDYIYQGLTSKMVK